MNSVERTWTVLHGGIPDRVPVDLHDFMMTANASGMLFSDFFQDAEAMAEWQINLWREFGHDVLLLESGTAALAEACGCAVLYLQGTAPFLAGPVLNSLDDVDKLRLPDPHKTHPLPVLLRATEIVAREIGQEAFLIGRGDQSPFVLAAQLLGTQELLSQITLGKNEEKIGRLMEFCAEVFCRFAAAQVEQGAHMTSAGDSLAGPDMLSPKLYEKWVWPTMKRVVERLRSQNISLAYHVCGSVTPIIGRMVDTGASIVEIDYQTDMTAAKEAARGKTTLLGPINPAQVMARGAPTQVREKCREAISVLGEGGGFILGPGCALPPTTPHENIRTMIEAAKRYGQYDSSGHLKPAD